MNEPKVGTNSHLCKKKKKSAVVSGGVRVQDNLNPNCPPVAQCLKATFLVLNPVECTVHTENTEALNKREKWNLELGIFCMSCS